MKVLKKTSQKACQIKNKMYFCTRFEKHAK